jgi:hypothetical protein
MADQQGQQRRGAFLKAQLIEYMELRPGIDYVDREQPDVRKRRRVGLIREGLDWGRALFDVAEFFLLFMKYPKVYLNEDLADLNSDEDFRLLFRGSGYKWALYQIWNQFSIHSERMDEPLRRRIYKFMDTYPAIQKSA